MIDNEDLEVLYLKYRKFSVNFALKYVDQVDVAEDISQDVFCKLYTSSMKVNLENEIMVRGLIKKVTTNCIKDYQKSALARREQQMEPDMMAECFESKKESPEEMMIQRQDMDNRWKVIQMLREKSPENYDIMMKTQYEERSPDSVAEEYGLSRNTLNNRIFRTRDWLKKELRRITHPD